MLGLDAFIPYYPRPVKERSQLALTRPGYCFHEVDLRNDPLDALVAGADVVFHLAAQARLVRSWTDLDDYSTCNVLATHRLLEALRRTATGLKRLLFASTSSVYGRFAVR